jgi:meso-butanediol dehydrogenase/(S,S)-butanediol dehydrogenase/diacetyl reductase
MRLENKIALITGGGSGIGLSSARLFSQEGAKVVVFGRRQDRLENTVQDIGKNKIEGNVLAVSGDITRHEDIKRLMETTINTHGRVDILVNSAGIFTGAPLHEMTDDEWNEAIDINMTGIFKLTREVLPHMIRQKSGSIVHISSILGLVATPGTSAYNVSKGALNQFSRSVAVEYGSSGIRSNAICPGLIATEMTADLMSDAELMKEWAKNYPIGRFGQPEDVARACLFLASDESSFITGAVLPVDGGYTAL